jgi:hypothetical protein
VYGFFHPKPKIEVIKGRRSHVFKCQGPENCQTTIRRYLDTGDARSTGNMRRHVASCWAKEALAACDSAADDKEVQNKIAPDILRNGSITATFERKANSGHTLIDLLHVLPCVDEDRASRVLYSLTMDGLPQRSAGLCTHARADC